MARALPFLLVVIMIVVLLWPWLRRRAMTPVPATGRADELVKDPVCRTYVVRSRAIRPAAASPYFCSAACAERWAAGPRR